MSRAVVNAHCAARPGAEVDDPWDGGLAAWKFDGKIFALVGALDDGASVKCPDIETARLLIDMGHAERAPYLHASWVRIPGRAVPESDLRERLTTSYRLVRAARPMTLQEAFPPA